LNNLTKARLKHVQNIMAKTETSMCWVIYENEGYSVQYKTEF